MNDILKQILIGIAVLVIVFIFSLIVEIFKGYGIELDIKILFLIGILYYVMNIYLRIK